MYIYRCRLILYICYIFFEINLRIKEIYIYIFINFWIFFLDIIDLDICILKKKEDYIFIDYIFLYFLIFILFLSFTNIFFCNFRAFEIFAEIMVSSLITLLDIDDKDDKYDKDGKYEED